MSLQQVVLLLFSLLTGVCLHAQNSRECVFEILIHEYNPWNSNHYRIGCDSIVIDKENEFRRLDSKPAITLRRKTTELEKSAIIKCLKSMGLDTLKTQYVNNSAPSHKYDYDFEIAIEGIVHKVHVYESNVKAIAQLVAMLNKKLVGHLKIGTSRLHLVQ